MSSVSENFYGTICFNPFEAAQRVLDVAVETIKTVCCLPFALAAPVDYFLDPEDCTFSKIAIMLECRTAVRTSIFVESFFGGDEEAIKARFVDLAAKRGSASFVKWMLDEGFSMESVSIEHVVRFGHDKVARLLVERGKSLDGVFERCIPKDDAQLLGFLLENGAQFNPEHDNLLRNAISDGDVEVVRLLIQYKIIAQENLDELDDALDTCENDEIKTLVNKALDFDAP